MLENELRKVNSELAINDVGPTYKPVVNNCIFFLHYALLFVGML